MSEMTSAQPEDARRATGLRRATGTSLLRDIAADWKRWGPGERVFAAIGAALVPVGLAALYLLLMMQGMR